MPYHHAAVRRGTPWLPLRNRIRVHAGEEWDFAQLAIGTYRMLGNAWLEDARVKLLLALIRSRDDGSHLPEIA